MSTKRYLNPIDSRPRDDWGNPNGKPYDQKEWGELTPGEMAMDFEWKSDILAVFGEEVSGSTFYQDYLFRELYSGEIEGYKVILTEYDAEDKKKVNKIDVDEICNYLHLNDVALSPCLFHKNWRRKNLLNYISAFVLDIDKLRPKQLQRFLRLFDEGRLLTPTFIANSGSGVHFYYLLDKMQRIDSVQNEANKLAATEIYRCLYNDVIKKEKWKDAQKHWLGQDYRVVNSKTKLHQISQVFKTGRTYTFDELIAHYSIQIDLDKNYATQKMIRYAENIAKDLGLQCPDFTDSKATYDFIAENKDAAYLAREERRKARAERENSRKGKKRRKPGTWYGNTLFHMRDHTSTGFRFSSLKALAMIAFKEKIPREKFIADVYELAAYWEEFDWGGDDFNTKNVEAIERLYDNALKYANTSSETLEEWLGYEFKRMGNKKNGRSRNEHLERARAVQKIDYPDGEWRNKNGAPSKAQLVYDWRKENPNGKPMDCVRATGLNKDTVYKWWNGEAGETKKKKSATVREADDRPKKDEIFDWRSHLAKTWGVPMEEILKFVKDYEDGKFAVDDAEEEEE